MPGETNEVMWRGVRPVSGIRGVWPERDATRVVEDVSQAGIGTAIIYTIAAGKRLFMSGFSHASRLSANGAYWSKLKVRDDNDTDVYTFNIHYFDIAGQMANGLFLSPALEVIEDYDVVLQSNHATLDTFATIFGWLEDM